MLPRTMHDCPHPPPASGRYQCASGHTLVEILVVLIIVAILSGLIVIRVGAFGAAAPAQQLDRLATLLTGWCEQAVFQQRNLAVRISHSGYDFWEPLTDTGATGVTDVSWREAAQTQFSPQAWEGEVTAQLLVTGQITELDLDMPQLRCFASSQMTPFTLRLQQATRQRTGVQPETASLSADSNGRLRLLD